MKKISGIFGKLFAFARKPPFKRPLPVYLSIPEDTYVAKSFGVISGMGFKKKETIENAERNMFEKINEQVT